MQSVGCGCVNLKWRYFRHSRIVDQDHRCCDRSHTAGSIRTCNTNACNSVWTVTDSITIGVWIQWISSCIARINIDTGIGFHRIEQAISVIISISNKTRGWSFSCIVIAWQIVWQSIAIVICKTLQIEREGYYRAIAMRGRHRVGRIAHGRVNHARYFARG